MPDCPTCRKTHATASALRLFNSENECPICFEKCPVMLALPCGHQFCKPDIERVGFKRAEVPSLPIVSRPRPPVVSRRLSTLVRRRLPGTGVPPPPLARVMRHITSRIRTPSRITPRSRRSRSTLRRRCGWCGHIGHTQRKCRVHRRQCGCKTYKRSRHKQLYKRKSECVICGKRGHQMASCHLIVNGV